MYINIQENINDTDYQYYISNGNGLEKEIYSYDIEVQTSYKGTPMNYDNNKFFTVNIDYISFDKVELWEFIEQEFMLEMGQIQNIVIEKKALKYPKVTLYTTTQLKKK